jgi:membrane protease YdiL (CAAX protease family)
MINPQQKPLRTGESYFRPGIQFLIFAGIFVLILFFGNLLGLGIAAAAFSLKEVTDVASLNLSSPHTSAILWILQTAGTTFPILAAPVVFSALVVRDVPEYLKVTFRFSWKLLPIVFVVMFMAFPAIEFLSNINQQMVLPTWLKWMRESEDSAEKMMNVMLTMKTLNAVIIDVIMIALVPAIVEEFMFRGVLQTIFVRWTKNVHVAVWVTAILFSAFHMEFFGFLPRLLLGALLGYFVAWSGSIWPAVWGHFINNATDVILTYLYRNHVSKTNPDDQHMFNYAGYLVSFVALLALLLYYRKTGAEKLPIQAYNGEELD